MNIRTWAAAALAASALALAGCGTAATTASTAPATQAPPASAAQTAQAPDPVAILARIHGIQLRPGEMALTNVNGTPYASGTLARDPASTAYADNVTVWTGLSVAAIKAANGPQAFAAGGPAWYAKGPGFILQITGAYGDTAPQVPIAVIAAQAGGHVVAAP